MYEYASYLLKVQQGWVGPRLVSTAKYIVRGPHCNVHNFLDYRLLDTFAIPRSFIMASIVSDDASYMPRALIERFMKVIVRYFERRSCIRGGYFIALRLFFALIIYFDTFSNRINRSPVFKGDVRS